MWVLGRQKQQMTAPLIFLQIRFLELAGVDVTHYTAFV